MNDRVGFIKTTILGGVVFLVPVIVVIAILGKALQLMKQVAQPLAGVLQIDTARDVIVFNLFAALLILAVCFVAGMLARTQAAYSLVRNLEARFLDRIPAYAFVKGMTASIGEATEGPGLTPVHVRFDDNAQIAFEVERLGDGSVVAYLPGAPNPWSGSVCIVEADRVTALDATMLEAADRIRHLGRGSDVLLRRPGGDS